MPFPAEKKHLPAKNAVIRGHIAGICRKWQEGFRAQESRTLAASQLSQDHYIFGVIFYSKLEIKAARTSTQNPSSLGISAYWEKLNRGVSKPGCFPLFSGKVQIVSRTLSGLFLVGALNRPRKRNGTNRENPRTIPEQIGKIPEKSGKSQKGQKRTKKEGQVQIGKHPRLKHPHLAALEWYTDILHLSGSHRSTHIANDLASRAVVRIAGISHRSILKNMPDFSHCRPTSQDFRRRFFWHFPVISDQANVFSHRYRKKNFSHR